MTRIYHITSKQEASEAQKTGIYTPAAFAREGFIHCSYANQVLAVANRIFRRRPDLVVLEIDPDTLDSKIIDENLEGGSELYPHVYGRLRMSAVIRIHSFPCDAEGKFSQGLPE
jgi:uncharacterized protein (DUF952 family)